MLNLFLSYGIFICAACVAFSTLMGHTCPQTYMSLAIPQMHIFISFWSFFDSSSVRLEEVKYLYELFLCNEWLVFEFRRKLNTTNEFLAQAHHTKCH
jgi:hypothetical protein